MNTATPVKPPDRATPDRILRRIDWQVIRRLDGVLQGDYRSLFYGTGLDFADLREYQAGDDVRRIDWNVTARMNAPYVRQYIEDREITAWFLLDLSPSMAFGRLERHKESVLGDFVATLARLLTRNGNRVGAIGRGLIPFCWPHPCLRNRGNLFSIWAVGWGRRPFALVRGCQACAFSALSGNRTTLPSRHATGLRFSPLILRPHRWNCQSKVLTMSSQIPPILTARLDIGHKIRGAKRRWAWIRRLPSGWMQRRAA